MQRLRPRPRNLRQRLPGFRTRLARLHRPHSRPRRHLCLAHLDRAALEPPRALRRRRGDAVRAHMSRRAGVPGVRQVDGAGPRYGRVRWRICGGHDDSGALTTLDRRLEHHEADQDPSIRLPSPSCSPIKALSCFGSSTTTPMVRIRTRLTCRKSSLVTQHTDKRARPISPCAVYALPLLTSLLDVTGQLLLVAAYVASGLKGTGSAVAEGAADEAAEALGETLRAAWRLVRLA